MLGNTFEMAKSDVQETKENAKRMIKSIKNGFLCLIFGHTKFDYLEWIFCGRCFADFPITEEMNQVETDEKFEALMEMYKRTYKKQVTE
jgi:hypothetical protein